MFYNVTDNRISIGDYFFEMDTEHNIHIYSKGMKYISCVEFSSSMSFDKFKDFCNRWFINRNDFKVLCPCCGIPMEQLFYDEENDFYYVCSRCNYQSNYLEEIKKKGKCQIIK